MAKTKKLSFINMFIFRWFVSSLGLWIAAGLLGDSIDYQERLRVIIISGLVLALVNTIVKPIVVFVTLPAILFSLGLFMIVINGFMLVIASKLYEPLHITSFGVAMLAGM